MMPVTKKSIAIIGEGETEWFYFDSLRVYHRYPFKMAPDFPSHSDIDSILKLAARYVNEGYDYVVCLIDMDRIDQIPAEKKKYQAEKGKRKNRNVLFIETNPCTEFWFLLHFLPSCSSKTYHSCNELLIELRKYLPQYDKTKKYLKKVDLYRFLKEHGDLNKAMQFSQQLCQLSEENPEDQISYSEIYKVIDLLRKLEPLKG